MRTTNGRFDLSFTAHEQSIYNGVIGRVELKRILTSPFGRDGRPAGVTPGQSQWARRVVQERPEWSLSVLREVVL